VRRRGGARKQSPRRSHRHTPAAAVAGLPLPTPAEPIAIAPSDSDYVGKLAAAIGQVIAAQDRLVQNIDAASREPQLLSDSAWQVGSRSAAEMVRNMADQLRIAPVPEALLPVDDILGRAQEEGRLASEAHTAAITAGNPQKMVATLEHLDRMAQLIEQAHGLLRH
jgi:hypothetical protein